MTLVAGLATLDHPYAGLDPSVAVHGALVAVPQPPGGRSREDRYALAVHWCAAGPFLPLSWHMSLSMEDMEACAAKAADPLRRAIEAAVGRVEFAFKLDRKAGAVPPCDAPRGGSGRAYLRSLKRAQTSCGTALDRLQALAAEARFTLSLFSRREHDASGLIACANDDADRVHQAVTTMFDRTADTRIAMAGPFPPFGAGAAAFARTGIGRVEPSA